MSKNYGRLITGTTPATNLQRLGKNEKAQAG